MNKKCALILGGVLCMATIVYLVATGAMMTSPLQKVAESWRAEYSSVSEVTACREFSSLEEAVAYFGTQYFRSMGACHHYQSDKRTIAFYDSGEIHGFLTCYEVSSNRFLCCAQLAKGYTKDYNVWRERCS